MSIWGQIHIHIDENQTPFQLWCLRWSRSVLMWYLNSSSHMVSDLTWRLHQEPGGVSAVQNQEGNCWTTLHLETEHCTMLHKQSCLWENSGIRSPLKSGSLIPWIVILLIILCGAWLSKRLKKPIATPKMNWRQG